MIQRLKRVITCMKDSRAILRHIGFYVGMTLLPVRRPRNINSSSHVSTSCVLPGVPLFGVHAVTMQSEQFLLQSYRRTGFRP